MDYEVVVPAAPKDYNKLPYLVNSIEKYLWPKPSHIYIIHPLTNDIKPSLDVAHTYIDEQLVLNLDPNLATGFRRSPWIYQQFLKLFQNVTRTPDYLVIDADLIINRDIRVFDVNTRKPYFFLGNDQNHEPYYRYTQDMFGFGREFNYSFISEMMLFNKEVTYLLLQVFEAQRGNRIRFALPTTREYKINWLYYVTCRNACDAWIPADYEIYGNFVEKYIPSMYIKKYIKNSLRGKYSQWTNEELENYIKEMKDTDYDVITAHTWI